MEYIELIQNIAGKSRIIIIDNVKYIIAEITYMGEREELKLAKYDDWEKKYYIDAKEKDTD